MSHGYYNNSRPSSTAADSLPSSGATTPTGTSNGSSLAGSISSVFGGLMRRWSEIPTSPVHAGGNWPPAAAAAAAAATAPSASPSKTMGNGLNGVFVPPPQQQHYHYRRAASPFRPPPLEPLCLRGYAETTPASARLLTPAVAEEVRIMVPARLQIVDDWRLAYSLDQDGASLATLYEKAGLYEGRRVGFVLVVRDTEGGTFGAYLSDYPHPAPKYFGTGECFLWRASELAALPPPPSADTTNLLRTTTLSPTASAHPAAAAAAAPSPISRPASAPPIRFKAFPYSGVNEYYMMCESHFLSLGAGDAKYGLWLDDGLERGHSSTCQTFGNEPLSDEGEKFGILGVELWVIGA